MSFLKRLNPEASKDNTLQVPAHHSGCCGEDSAICQFTTGPIATGNIISVTLNIDGVYKAFQVTSAAISDHRAVRDAIRGVLIDNGYLDFSDAYTSVSVAPNGAITVIGDCLIQSVNTSGVSAYSFEKKCELAGICKNCGVIIHGETPGTLSFNGTSSAINNSNPFDCNSTEDEIRTAIEDSLGVIGVDYTRVDVEQVCGSGLASFTIHFTGEPALLNGEELNKCGCYQSFV